MMFPLLRDLAGLNASIRVPIAVANRVLGFFPQAFHKWVDNPVSARDWGDAQLINAAFNVRADRVQRIYTASRPNQIWRTAITEHKAGQERLYLCEIEDVFLSRIVGCSINSRMKAWLGVDALPMAVTHQEHPLAETDHFDRGPQFWWRKVVHVPAKNKLLGLLGRVAECGHNAAMDPFFTLLPKTSKFLAYGSPTTTPNWRSSTGSKAPATG
jgi:transposase InsO family protein